MNMTAIERLFNENIAQKIFLISKYFVVWQLFAFFYKNVWSFTHLLVPINQERSHDFTRKGALTPTSGCCPYRFFLDSWKKNTK